MIYIKRKKIALTVLIIFVLLLAILLIWQWDNVKALYMGLVETEETLSEKRAENDKIITDTLLQYPELNIRDMTEDEKKALEEGTLTREELLLILQGKGESSNEKEPTEPELPTEPEVPIEPTEPNEPEVPVEPIEPELPTKPTEPQEPEKPEVPTEPTEPTQPTVQSVEERISTLVAEMYVLKAEFTSALKNLENTTLKDYAALSEAERTAEVKTSMMNKVLDTVAVMEKDCDTKVGKIIEELKALLKANSMDLSLVEAIEAAYKNEKTITKAEYINTYFK